MEINFYAEYFNDKNKKIEILEGGRTKKAIMDDDREIVELPTGNINDLSLPYEDRRYLESLKANRDKVTGNADRTINIEEDKGNNL